MGHRLAAPSEHMLLCKQARWSGEGKFYGLEARLQLYPTLFTGTIIHKLSKDLDVGKNRVANQLRFLVYPRPHDSTYKYIKEYSQDAPCTQGDQYYFQMTKKSRTC